MSTPQRSTEPTDDPSTAQATVADVPAEPDTVLPDPPPQDRRAAVAWHHFHDSATQPAPTTTPEPTPVPDDQPRADPESPEVIHTTTGPEGTHL